MANDSSGTKHCLKRRDFLLTSGMVGTTVLLTATGIPWPVRATTMGYPRKLLAKLSELETNLPVKIAYPDAAARSMLIKLGAPAGGGIGNDRDIVAFSTLCTHMGAILDGTYSAKHNCLGPCPLHMTRFDLTRHGIVVAGQATESLPQILLEVENDNIFGVGVMGLIYGRAANLG